jgi:hypothetical protein
MVMAILLLLFMVVLFILGYRGDSSGNFPPCPEWSREGKHVLKKGRDIHFLWGKGILWENQALRIAF